MEKLPPDSRVCIIGAGPAGLSAARHFLDGTSYHVVVYEQSDKVGGIWDYTPEVGTCSKTGLPVHSSMYERMKTNLPKELMAFPDFPFPEHELESFLHHTKVLKYLEDYARRFVTFSHG